MSDNVTSNNVKDVRTALARAVASRGVPDATIERAATELASINFPIRGIDICTLGICIDFMLEGEDWAQKLPDLVKLPGGRIRGIEVFPFGIVVPDIAHVRVSQSIDALSQVGG